MNKEVRFAFQIQQPIRRLRRKRGLFSFDRTSDWVGESGLNGNDRGRLGYGPFGSGIWSGWSHFIQTHRSTHWFIHSWMISCSTGASGCDGPPKHPLVVWSECVERKQPSPKSTSSLTTDGTSRLAFLWKRTGDCYGAYCREVVPVSFDLGERSQVCS